MNILSKIRDKQPALAGHVLAVIALAWLGVGLQGCAMAEAEEHDCPACPPGHSQPQMPCDVEPDPCGYLDARDLDNRTAQSRVELPSGDMPAISGTTLSATCLVAGRDAVPIPGISAYPGIPPPLNLLYCVFLD